MKSRSECLHSLIKLSEPIDLIRTSIAKYPWDFDGDQVEVTRNAVAEILTRYVNGELTSEIVEDWANLIEGREDLKFEQRYADVLGQMIYQLSNPTLTEPITIDLARRLLLKVTSNKDDRSV